jgi:Tol biopolymer transport system component
MNDLESQIRTAFHGHEGDAPRFDLSDARRIAGRTRRRQIVNAAGAGIATVAIAVATLTGVDAIRTAPAPADTPVSDLTREDGEVLRFTGVMERNPETGQLEPVAAGDLVAVDPRTGAERVLVEDLDIVHSARWSADGRWLAYQTGTVDDGTNLWVAGGSQAPRVVATADDPSPYADPRVELDWKWSPTGAELALIEQHSGLRTIDVATDETTDLGTVVDDLLQPGALPWPWAWSPDRTRLVFASQPSSAPKLYTVDARSGERSLLARLPGAESWVEKVRWSPDGAHIAVQTRDDPGGRLYLMNADGSDIQLVADHSNSLGLAWSPDGTRLAFGSAGESEVRIRVATTDGAAPAEIGTVARGLDLCAKTSWGYNYECSPTWSPDGTQVAFRIGETGKVTVFDAAGAGEAGPLDEPTFLGWDGGWYERPFW